MNSPKHKISPEIDLTLENKLLGGRVRRTPIDIRLERRVIGARDRMDLLNQRGINSTEILFEGMQATKIRNTGLRLDTFLGYFQVPADSEVSELVGKTRQLAQGLLDSDTHLPLDYFTNPDIPRRPRVSELKDNLVKVFQEVLGNPSLQRFHKEVGEIKKSLEEIHLK